MSALVTHLQSYLKGISRARQLYTAGAWTEHSTQSLFLEHVIGRDHCLYLCVDLRHIPNAKRSDALKYQIDSHSPWPDTSYQVAWRQGYAQLWLWPAQLLGRANQATLSHVEAVFWPALADGLRVIQCTTGYDLQYWQQGRLQASRWYATAPDLTQQQWFARSQGQRLAQLLVVQSPELLQQPWPSVRNNPVQSLMQHPAKLVRWGGLLMVLIVSLEVTALLQWRAQAQGYQIERERLEVQLTGVLEQRNQARKALAEFQQLSPLLEGIDSLRAQYLVTQRLATVLDFQVVSWSRQDLQVDLVIEGQVDGVLDIVNAVRGEGVRDVQVEPSHRANQYRLQLSLEPPLPDVADQRSVVEDALQGAVQDSMDTPQTPLDTVQSEPADAEGEQ